MRSVPDWKLFSKDSVRDVALAAVWAILASTMLDESDVYRYVTLGLVAFVLICHWRDLQLVSRDWLAVLCYGWAFYATARVVFGVVVYDAKGASEWLYIFPVLFPVIGVALYTMRRHLYLAAILLVIAGLICLLATVDIYQTIAGVRTAPLFHKNPIHAGVGSGMLFLTATFLLIYAIETGKLATRWKWPTVTLCVTTAILSLFAMLGAQSKGVWLALAGTAGFVALLSLLLLPKRWRILTLSALGIAAAIAVLSSSSVVTQVAGTTITAAERLTSGLASTNLTDAMQQAIEDPTTPDSMRERLELWFNALELFRAAPVFGHGNLWLEAWHKTTYANVRYTLLHNGYLEILVRHGVFGLAFFGVFMAAALQRLIAARQEGVIATSTLAYIVTISIFFLGTIATNSNNRLAIGESFFILASAAVFATTLLRGERHNPSADKIKAHRQRAEQSDLHHIHLSDSAASRVSHESGLEGKA